MQGQKRIGDTYPALVSWLSFVRGLWGRKRECSRSVAACQAKIRLLLIPQKIPGRPSPPNGRNRAHGGLWPAIRILLDFGRSFGGRRDGRVGKTGPNRPRPGLRLFEDLIANRLRELSGHLGLPGPAFGAALVGSRGVDGHHRAPPTDESSKNQRNDRRKPMPAHRHQKPREEADEPEKIAPAPEDGDGGDVRQRNVHNIHRINKEKKKQKEKNGGDGGGVGSFLLQKTGEFCSAVNNRDGLGGAAALYQAL